jgi:hypothetical protein
MASVSNALPRLFRWVFMVFAVFAAIGAVVICLVILINPKLPPGAHFGPIVIDVLGEPGTAALSPSGDDTNFTVTALRGNLILSAEKAGGLIEVIKRWGLPLTLMNMIFFAALFDLLRRLFRNVGRGDSFTLQSVRLVQILGGWLILFSLVSAFAEHWFAEAAFAYLAQHMTLTISGTALHLPPPHNRILPHVGFFPFDSPVFFSGLLVLALSEVFRQGLTLKSENDLTV